MEVSSLSKLCLESIADKMAMWCQSVLNEDFYKYLYTIGPFNDLSKFIKHPSKPNSSLHILMRQ